MNTRDDFSKPDWFANWKVFLIFAVLSFVFAFGLRAMELPKWDNPAFMVDGEYIMGTHDAYAWLAGAKGIGKAATNPMSGLVRMLGSVTGANYGNIGFWLPAVFAGFTAVAAFAWGVLLAGPWVGVCAGVYATSIPMYFYRTRLSYYDTDLITLLFPLIICLLLAKWLTFGIRKSWFPFSEKVEKFKPTVWEYSLPVIAGAFICFGKFWHADVLTFGLFSVLAAVLLILICGTKDNRPILLRGIFLLTLAAYWGVYGILASILFIILGAKYEPKLNFKFANIYIWLAAIAAVMLIGDAGLQIWSLSEKVISYLKPVSGGSKGTVSGIHYPGIAQSVIEAQNIKWSVLLTNLAGNAYLAGLGLLGYAFLLFRRPSALFFLPFAVMSLAAVKIGGRFSMFAGIVIGMGGAYLLYWLAYNFLTFRKKQSMCKAFASLCMIVFLLASVLPDYRKVLPSPIIYQDHAKALIAAEKFAPENSTFWTWWDWGYATMYFTGRKSFADGSRHGGRLLFPLAFAYSTPSYKQSNQFIKYCAAQNGNPAEVWDKMEVSRFQELIYSMGSKSLNYSSEPKQYIVTSWSDVRLAYWILYYGSIDAATGKGTHPEVSRIGTAFNLDKEKGKLKFHDGAIVPISGYDIAERGRGESRSYPGSVGPYLVFNTAVSQGFLVNDFARNSMLLKLHLCNPADPAVKKNFKIVYDGYPMVRIYEVI
ncbi:STT3 domain-containing protein [Maridesulfovibrio sp.]|uniref:STT3 domain-containing protein n=1 Tax=Maridesulfovibrio sp. TaxID=2795000 RepID=UPI003BAA9D2F